MNRAKEQLEVRQIQVFLDVPDVVAHPFVERNLGSTFDLPDASDSSNHVQPLALQA